MKQIRKTNIGYILLTPNHRNLYNKDGKYIGRYYSESLHEGILWKWLETYPGDPCYHELTEEEMTNAIIQVGDHTPDLVPLRQE
jgi:hypothetical protein